VAFLEHDWEGQGFSRAELPYLPFVIPSEEDEESALSVWVGHFCPTFFALRTELCCCTPDPLSRW